MRTVFYTALAIMIMAIAGGAPALAQRNDPPPLPEPLQNMVAEGAQMRYLGRMAGLDGWIAIKGGQEQYFYVTPDRRAFVMGLLFDGEGRVATLRQVRALQEEAGAETLDLFTGSEFMREGASAPNDAFAVQDNTQREFKTPAEQLLNDVQDSNWVALGDESAPAIYTFIDPQCPHCHAFIDDLRANYIENGIVQVRMIPVGFRNDTRAQAAFLLAVPNPETRWYQHLSGDENALPVVADINEQGVQRNLAIMQSWQVNVTPFTVYRAKTGDVKIVQGRVQNIEQMLSDLR